LSSGLALSALKNTALPPSDSICPTVSAPPFSSMSATTTAAPSFAYKTATALPILDPAPVTIADFVSSKLINGIRLNWFFIGCSSSEVSFFCKTGGIDPARCYRLHNSTASASHSILRCLFHKLHFRDDPDVFAHQDSSRFKRRVPVEVVVGPANLTTYRKASLLV